MAEVFSEKLAILTSELKDVAVNVDQLYMLASELATQHEMVISLSSRASGDTKKTTSLTRECKASYGYNLYQSNGTSNGTDSVCYWKTGCSPIEEEAPVSKETVRRPLIQQLSQPVLDVKEDRVQTSTAMSALYTTTATDRYSSVVDVADTPEHKYSALHTVPGQKKPSMAEKARASMESTPSSLSTNAAEYLLRDEWNRNKDGTTSFKRCQFQVEIQGTPDERVIVSPNLRFTLKFAHTMSVKKQSRTELAQERHCFLLNPTGQLRIAWCTICVMCLAYDGFFIPLQVFPIRSWAVFDMIEFVLVAFWSADILMTFRCGYIDGMNVVMKQREIAFRYLETWFVFDFLVCAGEWFIILNPWTNNLIFRFLKLVRLLRVAKIKSVLQPVEDRFNAAHLTLVLTLLKMTTGMLIAVHFVTCAWFLIGEHTQDGWTTYAELAPCGLAKISGPPVLDDQKELMFWYFHSARWVLAQVNGRTDQDPRRNITEMVFTCIVAVSGPLVFVSIFVSSITASMMELSRAAKNKRMRVLQLNTFLKSHSISVQLATIMKLHVRKTKDLQDESVVLEMFPWNVRQDLLYEIRLPVVGSHHVFRLIQKHFPRAVRHICIHAMETHRVLHGENVFSRGDACSRMFFVVRGTFHYTKMVGEEVIEPTFSKTGLRPYQSNMMGIWFCEAALWLEWYNQGDLRTTSDAQFLVLEAKMLAESLKTYWQTRPLVCAYAVEFHSKLVEYGHVSDIIDMRVRITRTSRTSKNWQSEEALGSPLGSNDLGNPLGSVCL